MRQNKHHTNICVSLAQAKNPCSGETTNSEGCCNANSHLGEPLLTWVRPPLNQRRGPSLGLKTAATCQGPHAFSLRQAPLAWARCLLANMRALHLSESSSVNLACFYKSRLGEIGLLGQEHSFLVTVSLQQPHPRIHTTIPRHFMHS